MNLWHPKNRAGSPNKIGSYFGVFQTKKSENDETLGVHLRKCKHCKKPHKIRAEGKMLDKHIDLPFLVLSSDIPQLW